MDTNLPVFGNEKKLMVICLMIDPSEYRFCSSFLESTIVSIVITNL